MKYDIGRAAKKLGIGEASLKNHINSFYRDFSSNLDRIRDVLGTTDFDRIYFEFHRLKSTFKMISADEAEEICRRCCDLSKEKEIHNYSEEMAQVVSLAGSIYRQINGI